MNIIDVIDLIELRLLRSGISDTPPDLIRNVISVKLREASGSIEDVSYNLVTDGSREYELPDGMSRVEFVTVDGYEAVQCSPEQGDRSNAETSVSD